MADPVSSTTNRGAGAQITAQAGAWARVDPQPLHQLIPSWIDGDDPGDTDAATALRYNVAGFVPRLSTAIDLEALP